MLWSMGSRTRLNNNKIMDFFKSVGGGEPSKTVVPNLFHTADWFSREVSMRGWVGHVCFHVGGMRASVRVWVRCLHAW